LVHDVMEVESEVSSERPASANVESAIEEHALNPRLRDLVDDIAILVNKPQARHGSPSPHCTGHTESEDSCSCWIPQETWGRCDQVWSLQSRDASYIPDRPAVEPCNTGASAD